MENSDSTNVSSPLSLKKENVMQINPNAKIAELSESRKELFSRIQNLKQDLQNWRMKMETQVTVCRDELSELKKSLNTEVDQLRSEFKELKSTIQQQQEDVTASLRDLGDVSEESKEAEGLKNVDTAQNLLEEVDGKENHE